ncbi:tetratricopeptide repeat protein [Anaeromicropila populeti]|uniref:Tetratricopeptide repeat-containing protein n=1 Tax=Anaeromicropila populeti TaxID=37658 RepID=A0A1I6HMT6_9FIRM|nr:tetratricopeptide repeat protein [Anaeromicropila populeti]SFR55793.1 Tetratricopeptide repeat-containing protein [Anaeromicropila populeti]
MENSRIWDILGLEKTKDQNRIKQAYREKLVQVNPEDNPEGFKELRGAYEAAVQYAQGNEEEEINEPWEKTGNPVIDAWMEQVSDTYCSISRRIDPKEWKKLVEDEVCTALDTSIEAKECLLNFLMNHFRLPNCVWKVLEDEFRFIETQEELEENYSKQFINFIVYQIKNEFFIDMKLFEGDENADYDKYINQYFNLKERIDGKNFEGIEAVFTDIEHLHIYHPYLDVEKLRVALAREDYERACEIADCLGEKYKENTYCLFFSAEVSWRKKEYDRAAEIYQEILKIAPDHYSAKLKMAEYYYLMEDYEHSKEFYLEVLDVEPNDEQALEAMRKVNDFLIQDFEQKLEQEPDKLKIRLEMGWCFFQNEKLQECIQLLEGLEPDEENAIDYYNLAGRTYLAMNNHNNALPYLLKWLEYIKDVEDDGTKENQRRKKRLGYANYTIAVCYQELAQEEESLEEFFKKAFYFLDEAIKAEKDDNMRRIYLTEQARAYLKINQNEACIDICDKILSEDEGYYPAYINRQEAYFNLKYGQNVIDDFYAAISIYPGYVKPYELAAKVFLYIEQYKDALDIIQKAEENQLESGELQLIQIKINRYTWDTIEERKRCLKLCESLLEKVELDNGVIERVEELHFEMALFYLDMEQLEEGMEQIEKAIALSPESYQYYLVKADLLMTQGKYKEALSFYQELEVNFPDNPLVLYDSGDCHEKNNLIEEALERFGKVLLLYPEHRSANGRIKNIYLDRYRETEKLEYFQKALIHANQQLEVLENDYYFIDRGLLYLAGYRLEEAMEDFQKALQLNPRNLFAYNNAGFVYKILEQYDKALEMYQHAVEELEEESSVLPYGNMGVCYEVLGQGEKAVECYQKNIKLYPDNCSCYEDAADILRTLKRYDEAVHYYEDALNKSKTSKSYYLAKIANTYLEAGKEKLGLKFYQQSIEADKKNSTPLTELGEYYFYISGNPKKALKYFKAAYEIEKNNQDSDYFQCCGNLIMTYGFLKKKDKAAKYYQLAMKFLEETYGGSDKYTDYLPYRPQRLYNIGIIYYNMELYEQAKECFEKMNSCTKCRNCHYRFCWEALYGEALLLELEGKYEEARERYQKIADCDPNIIEVKWKLKNQKKLNKK